MRLAPILLTLGNAWTLRSSNALVADEQAMTVDEALRAVQARIALPEEIQHALNQKGAAQKQGGFDAAHLQRAHEILNQMYETEQSELDVLHEDCQDFIEHVKAELSLNRATTAMLGSESGSARAENQRASLVINTALNSLKRTKDEAAASGTQCDKTHATLRIQLELLQSDYQIVMQVLIITSCAGEAFLHGGAEAPFLLLQCGAHGRRELRLGGKAASWTRELRSPLAEAALKRATAAVSRGPVVWLQGAQIPEGGEKCTVSGSPQCGVIVDAIASMNGEIYDGIVDVQKQLEESEAECKRLDEDYLTQTKELESQQEGAEVKMATSVRTINENDQSQTLKNQQAQDLEAQLTAKQDECKEKGWAIAATMCGIKTIRQEIYIMAGEKPFIQDCEVGEWQPGDCTVSCAGGERYLTREIVAEASGGGAQGPPLQMRVACNHQPCPIDCEMSDWSGFSGCSKDCGGGIMMRSRVEEKSPEYGGEGCPEADEAVECNTDACDADCMLQLWSDWSTCSSACGGGVRARTKAVWPGYEARGMGACAEADDPSRLSTEPCNEDACPESLECTSKVDLILVVDSSGSLRSEGKSLEHAVLSEITGRLDLAGDARVGVIEFGTDSVVSAPLGAAVPTLPEEVDVGEKTKLPAALELALNQLTSNGREDAASIVAVLTDGGANSREDTAFVAAKVKEVARLVFIATSDRDHESLSAWASVPAQQNLLLADEPPSRLVAAICPEVNCTGTVTDENRTQCESFR
jgi:uncharacterized protein YegL